MISSRGSTFETGDDGASGDRRLRSDGAAPGSQTLERHEHDYILATLEKHHWQVKGDGGVAEILGINASTLRGRMRKLGIRRPGSRPPDSPPRRAPCTSRPRLR